MNLSFLPYFVVIHEDVQSILFEIFIASAFQSKGVISKPATSSSPIVLKYRSESSDDLVQIYTNIYVQDEQLVHPLNQNLFNKVRQGQMFESLAVKIIRMVIQVPIHNGRILPRQLPQDVHLGNNVIKQTHCAHDRIPQRGISHHRASTRAFRPLQVHEGIDRFHQGESCRVALFLASAKYADGDQRPESEVEEVRRGVEAARDLAVVESYSFEHHREWEGLKCPAGHLIGARADEIVGLKFLCSGELQDWFVALRHFFLNFFSVVDIFFSKDGKAFF